MSLSLGTGHRSRRVCAIGIGAPAPVTWTILVAEDDPAVRAYIAEVLQTQRYYVLEAGDGIEALEVAAQHCGPIHLLLTDLAMPGLDGRELHRLLTRQRPETSTLFMSGFHVTELHSAAAFLPKPIAPRVLLRKVRETLRNQMRRTARNTLHEQRSSHDRSGLSAK